MKILMVVALLAGCAGGPMLLSQAGVMPTLTPEPPPFFPAPGYTPAGAGASPLGNPWQAPEARVERSPNKRVLPVDPSDPAPGLWAADEVKASAVGPPRVEDIELPLAEADISGFETATCVADITRFLRSEGQLKATMELRFDYRQCVIARLYDFCLARELANAETAEQRRARLDTMRTQARSFLMYACRNVREGRQDVEKIVKETARAWDLLKKKGRK